ncbi:hypothetical protein SAMN05428982_2753 [Pseudoxanthomonas sp. CF385]|uniref:hypothetical protein n=1 Tax=Pseudoxanthomonas sp. CF385 TaxID=1881042 RepID=UPI000882C3ED|nr:hypothetical protein [Pseudoxanthomonas sp. CF385]SDQ98568.1 hypothetical protein SAMN05428982_2753 [Pseudoxanthomonas sp. CF385]
MRDYGKVHTSFWESPSARALTGDGRYLALYLLTCKHNTTAGAFRLPDGYACEDLQWTFERLHEVFRELIESGFATRCEVSKWVFIHKHLDWNPPENPNQGKAVAKVAAMVPESCSWKQEFEMVLSRFQTVPQSTRNPSETVPEPFANQKQKQKQKQKNDGAGAPESSFENLSNEGSEELAQITKQPAALGVCELIAEGIDPQHAKDWLKVRKDNRAPLTQTAWDGVKAEAAKAGITPAQAVEIAATSSWRGFKADWVMSGSMKQGTAAEVSKASQPGGGRKRLGS